MFKILKVRARNTEFGYKPRFYDPDKEALQAKINSRKNKNADGEVTKLNLRQEFGSMRRQGSSRSSAGTSGRTSYFRLGLILVTLIVIAYVVINTWLPKFMEMLFPVHDEVQYELLDPYENFDEATPPTSRELNK